MKHLRIVAPHVSTGPRIFPGAEVHCPRHGRQTMTMEGPGCLACALELERAKAAGLQPVSFRRLYFYEFADVFCSPEGDTPNTWNGETYREQAAALVARALAPGRVLEHRAQVVSAPLNTENPRVALYFVHFAGTGWTALDYLRAIEDVPVYNLTPKI